MITVARLKERKLGERPRSCGASGEALTSRVDGRCIGVPGAESAIGTTVPVKDAEGLS